MQFESLISCTVLRKNKTRFLIFEAELRLEPVQPWRCALIKKKQPHPQSCDHLGNDTMPKKKKDKKKGDKKGKKNAEEEKEVEQKPYEAPDSSYKEVELKRE